MRLRFVHSRDAVGIVAIYAPIVAETTISFEVTPPDAATIAQRAHTLWPTYPWIVATDDADTQVLGYAYAGPFRTRAAYRWSVETTVYVAEHARRKRVARTLYAALFRLLGAQGYRRAFAVVTLPNEPSLAAHRAVGFTDAGTWRACGWKFGAWHDVALLERPLGSEPEAPADEPIPLSAVPPETIAAALER
jgi:phosphinothricin acetyltransferase